MMKKILAIALAGVLLTGCGVKQTQSLAVKFEKAGEVNVLDSDCVAVYTEYTNKNKESTLPADDVNVKAYQNGTELSPIVPTGEKTDGYDQCDTSIESGATAKVVWIFKLSDDSKVTVDIDGNKQEVNLSN